MRLMKFVPPILTLGLILIAVPAKSQVVPAYQAHGLPISLGVGPSIFNPDWGYGQMWGGTIWGDWYPAFMPQTLHGLGLEFEARDISKGQHLPTQKNIRQDTAQAGAIYSYRRFTNFQPYVKCLFGYGSYDFTSPSPTYSHDTRGLIAPGGGLEYRVYGPMWARVDYEYQMWQKLFSGYPTPQGFTFGVSYNFSPRVH
jgi:opacity protein-like surface antigen